jgi:hypothetical protein
VIVHLDKVDDWLEIPIPASTPTVRLHRLHLDPDTGASLSLVRFPAGWSRPGTGSYNVAEEFLLLDGELRMGRTFRAADYAYMPPRTIRPQSASPQGALALAWFSGPLAWSGGVPETAAPGDPVVVAAGSATAPLRRDAPEVPGDYRVTGEPVVGAGRGSDVLCPARRAWEWAPAGQAAELTSATLHVRTWG